MQGLLLHQQHCAASNGFIITCCRLTDQLSVRCCSSPTQAGRKGSSRSQSAPKPEAKGSQGLNKETNPVQEWIADGTAELEQEGVDPKFAVSLNAHVSADL